MASFWCHPYSLSFHSGTPKFLSVYDKYVRNCSSHTGAVMTLEPVSSASPEMYFEVTVEVRLLPSAIRDLDLKQTGAHRNFLGRSYAWASSRRSTIAINSLETKRE